MAKRDANLPRVTGKGPRKLSANVPPKSTSASSPETPNDGSQEDPLPQCYSALTLASLEDTALLHSRQARAALQGASVLRTVTFTASYEGAITGA